MVRALGETDGPPNDLGCDQDEEAHEGQDDRRTDEHEGGGHDTAEVLGRFHLLRRHLVAGGGHAPSHFGVHDRLSGAAGSEEEDGSEHDHYQHCRAPFSVGSASEDRGGAGPDIDEVVDDGWGFGGRGVGHFGPRLGWGVERSYRSGVF
jgi:hypothetical protein